MNELDIFSAALELADPTARKYYLDKACRNQPELRKRIDALLLNAAQASRFLEAPAKELEQTLAQTPTEKPGMVIGPYKLLQLVGEGGMGSVYMAEQFKPVSRRVALKIIKPGMDTNQVIARFEAERQALSLMDHPNIARVLDAGTTDAGRPYFVMELVKGIPITDYCDEHQLTPRERLELFLPVLHAVQHAHQKGIIHRDIKPSNVLVAEYDHQAVPKVIDFGVAKATSQKLTEKTMFTGLGQIVGTFEYMSPEQAKVNQLDIDTRSDIYSLGVLLYELLTGSTPFDKQRLRSAAFDELLRIIREEEPPMPSTRLSKFDTLASIGAKRKTEPKRLSSIMRGELDWIVMKALDKDRSRRYETANGFAADVKRYLADEPVQACPPSFMYRLSKFTRRYRAPMATAAALLITLLAATIFSAGSAIVAVKSRESAIKASVIAEAEGKRATQQAEEANLQREEANRQKEEAKRQAEFAKHQEAEANLQKDEVIRQKTEVEKQRQLAVDEQRNAIVQRDEKNQALYVASMRLASSDLAANNIARMHETLINFEPSKDSGEGSWEWYYLLGKSHDETDNLQGASLFASATGAIGGANWSPNGEFVAFPSDRDQIAIWEVSSKRILRRIEGEKVIAWSPDNGRIAYRVGVSGIEILRLADDKRVPLTGHSRVVESIAWSPDGKRLASTSWDSTFRIWDSVSGECLLTRKAGNFVISDVAWSPNGQKFVTSSKFGELISPRVWNASTGELELELNRKLALDQINFSNDGTHIIGCSLNGKVIIWQVTDGQEVTDFSPHAGTIKGLAINPKDEQFATGGSDGLIHIWSFPDAKKLVTFRGHDSPIASVDWKSDGKQLVSSDSNGRVMFWGLDHVKSDRRIENTTSPTKGFVWADNDHLNLFPYRNTTLTVNSKSALPVKRETIFANEVDFGALKFSREYITEFLRLLNKSPSKLKPRIGSWEWSNDGRRIAYRWPAQGTYSQVLSEDGTYKESDRAILIGVWDVTTVEQLAQVKVPVGSLAMQFSPDSRQLAIFGANERRFTGGLSLLDVATGKVTLLPFRPGDQAASAVSWTRDGKQIACGNEVGMLFVWDVASQQVVLSSKIHHTAIKSPRWSADGRRIAIGTDSGEVMILDGKTGQELLRLDASVSSIVQIDWSPDDRQLAALDVNGIVYIWDASRGYEYAISDNYSIDRLNQARTLARNDKLSDALTLFSSIVVEEKDSYKAIELQMEQAQLLVQSGRFTEAIALYDSMARNETDRDKVQQLRLTMVSLLNKFDKMPEALTVLESVIALDNKNAEALFLRANVLKSLKKMDSAIADLGRITDLNPKDASAWNTLGIELLNLKQYQAAIMPLSKAIELSQDPNFVDPGGLGARGTPPNPGARGAVNPLGGQVLPIAPGARGARGPIQRLTSIGQGGPTGLIATAALINRSEAYLGIGNHAAAIEDLRSAITQGVSSEPLVRLALAYAASGDLSSYSKTCKEFIETSPSPPTGARAGVSISPVGLDGRKRLGILAAALVPNGHDDYANHIQIAKELVERNLGTTQSPVNTGTFRQALGAILFRADRAEEAIPHLMAALEATSALTTTPTVPNSTTTAPPVAYLPAAIANQVQLNSMFSWYFLALSHQALKNNAEAVKYLDLANTASEKELSAYSSMNRTSRLMLELLRIEANEMIRDRK